MSYSWKSSSPFSYMPELAFQILWNLRNDWPFHSFCIRAEVPRASVTEVNSNSGSNRSRPLFSRFVLFHSLWNLEHSILLLCMKSSNSLYAITSLSAAHRPRFRLLNTQSTLTLLFISELLLLSDGYAGTVSIWPIEISVSILIIAVVESCIYHFQPESTNRNNAMAKFCW